MSLTHLLTDAVQADREREIRARAPRNLGVASGPRHPNEHESASVPPAPASNPKPVARPRVAWGG
jgi:hypothetical protein